MPGLVLWLCVGAHLRRIDWWVSFRTHGDRNVEWFIKYSNCPLYVVIVPRVETPVTRGEENPPLPSEEMWCGFPWLTVESSVKTSSTFPVGFVFTLTSFAVDQLARKITRSPREGKLGEETSGILLHEGFLSITKCVISRIPKKNHREKLEICRIRTLTLYTPIHYQMSFTQILLKG